MIISKSDKSANVIFPNFHHSTIRTIMGGRRSNIVPIEHCADRTLCGSNIVRIEHCADRTSCRSKFFKASRFVLEYAVEVSLICLATRFPCGIIHAWSKPWWSFLSTGTHLTEDQRLWSAGNISRDRKNNRF